MNSEEQNKIANELLDELFEEEKLLSELQRITEEEDKIQKKVHDFFYPKLCALVDEAVTDLENQDDILRMIRKEMVKLTETLVPAFVLQYMDTKELRENYLKVNKLGKYR